MQIQLGKVNQISRNIIKIQTEKIITLHIFSHLFFFFFLISKENFIQRHNNESPKYTGSIQQGTKIIKYINYKHPSNHRPKK